MKGLTRYIGSTRRSERLLAEAFRSVADRHQNEFEVHEQCRHMAEWSRSHSDALGEMTRRYGERRPSDADSLRSALFHGGRWGGLGLLHDLQDLLIMANAVSTEWLILKQAAQTIADPQFVELCTEAAGSNQRQVAWLKTQIKHVAPQALTVPPHLVDELGASIPKRPTLAAVPDYLRVPLAAAAVLFAAGLVRVFLQRTGWTFSAAYPRVALRFTPG